MRVRKRYKKAPMELIIFMATTLEKDRGKESYDGIWLTFDGYRKRYFIYAEKHQWTWIQSNIIKVGVWGNEKFDGVITIKNKDKGVICLDETKAKKDKIQDILEDC